MSIKVPEEDNQGREVLVKILAASGARVVPRKRVRKGDIIIKVKGAKRGLPLSFCKNK
ncbi:MAG: hypothetical protein AAB575_04635 [Patescibacteria group bacterium]